MDNKNIQAIEKLRVIDKDTCPERDNIIIQNQCSSCKHYSGFELYNGQRCVKCDYFDN